MAQAAVVVICGICETDKDVKFYCVNCDENLCTNCNNVHSKIKKTKNDKVILISEARKEGIAKTPVILCSEHSEDVALYCKQCDQFVCTECLTGKHKDHNVTSLKDVKHKAINELTSLQKTFQMKMSVYEEAIKAEGKAHGELMSAIDLCKNNIYDQKRKLMKELDSICEEEVSELTSLQTRETTKYNDACAKLQTQCQALTLGLQTLKNGIDSGHPATMAKAKTDAINISEGLKTLEARQINSPVFKRATINRQGMRHNLGQVQHKTEVVRLPPEVVTKETEQQLPNQHTGAIDTSKVRIKSTIKIKGKVFGIKAIIPADKNSIWISAYEDNHLTLINNNGDVIMNSVKVGSSRIVDAKAYNKGILITCYNQSKIFKMFSNGNKTSVFCDMNPYHALGLCVTHNLEVLVCLVSSTKDGKVVRLGSCGTVKQNIQYNSTGAPLFRHPYSVTSLPTGTVVVVDWREPERIVGVDKNGNHLFTWMGETKKEYGSGFCPCCVTHDSYNVFVTDFLHSRLFAIREDGTEAKYLLGRPQGIETPKAMAMNDDGLLFVGCSDGKLHIIEY